MGLTCCLYKGEMIRSLMCLFLRCVLTSQWHSGLFSQSFSLQYRITLALWGFPTTAHLNKSVQSPGLL